MEVAAVLGRAYLAADQGIRYGIGKGGMQPGAATPAAKGLCDCTGFVAWCLGFSRKLDDMFYKNFNGGWFETTAVWTDIGRDVGIMEELKTPKIGAVLVYPDKSGSHGHIGIVTDLSSTKKVRKVIHCSSGNDRDFGNAIQETDPEVFSVSDVRTGWLVGLQ